MFLSDNPSSESSCSRGVATTARGDDVSKKHPSCIVVQITILPNDKYKV